MANIKTVTETTTTNTEKEAVNATPAQKQAAIQAIRAIADAIRALGTVPSGHLYSNSVMAFMTLDQYNQVLGMLTRAQLIKVDGSHLITWTGPK